MNRFRGAVSHSEFNERKDNRLFYVSFAPQNIGIEVEIVGAYQLTETFGNYGWKVNGKVTFPKIQAKIEENALRQSVHSGWYEPNEMLLTIYQFLGSLSVPDSRYTNSPIFWIQTVTDVAILRYTGKLVIIMLSTPRPDFAVKWYSTQ